MHDSPHPSPPAPRPLQTGTVVIGRNEGERLERCLASLDNRPPIVYVDSGSTDGSPGKAAAAGAHVLQLDMTRPFSMARARNAGFQHIREHHPQVEAVQFIDGDCQIVPTWPEQAAAFLATHPHIAAVAGRRREQNPRHSIYNRICDIEWNTPPGSVQAIGGDALIRALPFEQVGGFTEALIAGEEPELCYRLRRNGWLIWRLEAEMTRHDAAIHSFRQWWRRMKRGGYAAADVHHRWAPHAPRTDIPFSFMRQSARRWTLVWAAATLLATFASFFLFASPLPGFLLGIAVWALQALRIAYGVRHRADHPGTAIAYGFITMISKWAEIAGHHQLATDQRAGQAALLIEYKS